MGEKKCVRRRAFIVGLAATVATATAAAAGWSNSLAINNVSVESTGGGNGTLTYIDITNPTGEPACGTSGASVLSGTADHVKSMTTIATSAFLAGRNVKVYFDGTCTSTYSKVTGIQML